MTIDTAYMITAFVTMLVVIDPIAIVPIFLALTPGMDTKQRARLALRAVLVAGLLLALFAFFGKAVLGFIGISMPAFRVAGGILLFLTAMDMLFERRTKRREDSSDPDHGLPHDDHNDPSVFPMAIPLIAGPGAIASVILLVGQKPSGQRAGTCHGQSCHQRDHPCAGHASCRAVGSVRPRRFGRVRFCHRTWIAPSSSYIERNQKEPP